MQALEVPQSASMQGYLAAEDWDNAYKVNVQHVVPCSLLWNFTIGALALRSLAQCICL